MMKFLIVAIGFLFCNQSFALAAPPCVCGVSCLCRTGECCGQQNCPAVGTTSFPTVVSGSHYEYQPVYGPLGRHRGYKLVLVQNTGTYGRVILQAGSACANGACRLP